jgi:peroxiredoxin family protein
MKPALVVFLHSHRYDRLYQATSLLLTASAMGWPCHLFLFYGALASFVAGTWDDVNITDVEPETTSTPPWLPGLENGFESANLPSLYGMLKKASAESGGLTICACSNSCKMLGLELSEVREKVDEIVGLPTMLQIAESAKHVLYI